MQTQTTTETRTAIQEQTISQPGKALTIREEAERFKGQLEAQRDHFAPALPSHITPERFQRTVITAVNLNQALLRADRRSLFNACSKAASDGLLPDGREGALVIFRKKVKDSQGREGWENYVQWMPMVYGIIKKARQSGEISVLDAQIVYSEELKPRTDPETGEQLPPRFVYKRVDGVPKIDHEPIVFGERGHATLVYSVVKFKDGSIDYEVLHADDVAKIRAMSKSKDSGPWSQWTDEMWKKSAIRRHAKRLPVSAELFETISRDDEITEFERQRVVAENKMLTAARTQLGASVEAEIIDPEPGHEATDHADESQVAATDYVD